MNFTVRFKGDSYNVRQAVNSMLDFDSITLVPKDFGIHSMVPIAEDYFYYLLSKSGRVSEKEGQKSLKRFEDETAEIGDVLTCAYKAFAEKMVEYLDEYGACTSSDWRERNWGVSKHPDCFIN